MDLVLRKRISVKVYKRQSWKDSLLKKITRVSTFILFATPETLRAMGTSFLREDFWDRLGGQALVMIGRWYSRQTLTNQKLPLSTSRSQKSFRRQLVRMMFPLHFLEWGIVVLINSGE